MQKEVKNFNKKLEFVNKSANFQDKLILMEAIKKAELTVGLPKYKPNIGVDLLMDAVKDLLILCEK